MKQVTDPTKLEVRGLYKLQTPGGGNHGATLGSAFQKLTQLEGKNNGDMELRCIADTNLHKDRRGEENFIRFQKFLPCGMDKIS